MLKYTYPSVHVDIKSKHLPFQDDASASTTRQVIIVRSAHPDGMGMHWLEQRMTVNSARVQMMGSVSRCWMVKSFVSTAKRDTRVRE